MTTPEPASRRPWPAGSATGIGSLPGTDVLDATKMVFGELADMPHLPELPARGPGADLIGRGAGLLAELPVETYAGRWRAARRGGRDLRRTRDLLDRDLDALTEAGQGYAGPIKIQAAGPLTLAAGLDLAVGGPMLRDHGAVRDLAVSLADGLRAHVADVVRRLPATSVLLQLDEPALVAVLAGEVPTESGLYRLRAVPASAARSMLRHIVDTVGVPVIVHCCAPNVPLGLLRDAGARAVSVDLTLIAGSLDLGPLDLGGSSGTSTSVVLSSGADDIAAMDTLGELLDADLGLFAGAVPTSPLTGRPPAPAQIADAVTTLWRRLGLPLSRLPDQVVITPACGLAGASTEYARAALSACVQAGRRLADQ